MLSGGGQKRLVQPVTLLAACLRLHRQRQQQQHGNKQVLHIVLILMLLKRVF
jgi:hypothetical protein